MLSDEEKQAIAAECQHCMEKQGASLEALKILQRRRGWISDESLHDICDYLDMTVEELDGVASFYNLIFRKPVGRHVIYLCDSVSCWMLGYDRLREAVCARLGIDFGETDREGRFTLLPIACLGACDHAPALMIDEDLHHDVGVEQLEGILARYV